MILVLLSSFNIPNRFFKILSTIFFIIVIFFLFVCVSESFGVAGYSGIPACFGVLVLRYSGVFQCSGVPFFLCSVVPIFSCTSF